MFITLTISTQQKPKKINKWKINPAFVLKKPINSKKRTFWQKFKSWRRRSKNNVCALGGQAIMF